MFVIGLTGGIGTGKTEASKVLREFGAELLSADAAGHEVYRRDTPGWRAVVDEFGEDVLSSDGEVDRRKLGHLVFENEDALQRLNAIVHPRIRSLLAQRLQDLDKRGVGVVVIEAALLIEAGWGDLVDEIWVTVAPENIVVERVHERSNLGRDAVLSRVRSQMPQEEREAAADVVVDNSDSLSSLERIVRRLWDERIPKGRKQVDNS